MNSKNKFRYARITALCAALGFASLASAQTTTVTTVPVGAVTYTVPAFATRAITFPLIDEASGSGQISGKITSITSNKISNSLAGWTVGSFSNPATPFYIRITSGLAAGRLFLISTSTANTGTDVTVTNDGTDLTTLGISLGNDTYDIIPADTLGSLFGANTMQGGASASTADVVYVWNTSSFLKFYYNTTRNRWERDVDTGTSPTRDTFVLRPDRGIMIQRNSGTPLMFTVTGRVQDRSFKAVHNTNGTSFINYPFPVAVTLNALNLQNQPGWKKWNDPLTAAANADLVQIWNSSSWLLFYFDSVNNQWQRVGDSNKTNRNTYSIAACVPIITRRLTNDQVKTITFTIPYTL